MLSNSFLKRCTNLQSHQQCRRVLIALPALSLHLSHLDGCVMLFLICNFWMTNNCAFLYNYWKFGFLLLVSACSSLCLFFYWDVWHFFIAFQEIFCILASGPLSVLCAANIHGPLWLYLSLFSSFYSLICVFWYADFLILICSNWWIFSLLVSTFWVLRNLSHDYENRTLYITYYKPYCFAINMKVCDLCRTYS